MKQIPAQGVTMVGAGDWMQDFGGLGFRVAYGLGLFRV